MIVESYLSYVLLEQLKGQSSNPLQGEEGWSHSMSAFGELVAICEEHKIPLIVFFKRSPGENNPLFEDVVRHALGVPVKDMGQWFEGLDEYSLVISKVDGYPNAEGHRVMAEHMADEIGSYIASVKRSGECRLFWLRNVSLRDQRHTARSSPLKLSP